MVLIYIFLLIFLLLLLIKKNICLSCKIVFSCVFFIISLFFFAISFDESIVKLSDDYSYYEEQKAIFGEKDLVDIPPNIVIYSSNKKFVTARQKPKYNYDSMYVYNENYKYVNGLETEYYWLIVLKEKKVFGPLEYNDFYDICNEYSVSEQMIASVSLK